MSAAQWAFGVDVGGTNIKAGLVDDALSILWRSSIQTRSQEGPEAILDDVAGLVSTCMRDRGLSDADVAGVCLGLPGLLDCEKGVVQTLVNIPGWEGFAVCAYLREKLGMETKIDHDLRIVTRGEMLRGAGRGLRDFVLAAIGTGIGISIVIDGKIYRRSTGDLGHVTIDYEGRRCVCGGIGCLERYVSGPALDEEIKKALERGKIEHVITHKELAGRAQSGESWAKEIFDRAGRYLGFGMLNVVALLNPEVFIIGGGLAQLGNLLLKPAIRVLQRHAYMFSNPRERVRLAQLGDDAGIIGAAALAFGMEG